MRASPHCSYWPYYDLEVIYTLLPQGKGLRLIPTLRVWAGFGFRFQGLEVSDFVFRISCFGFRVSDFRGWRFWVRVSGFGFQGSEVSDFEVRILEIGGFGSRVSDFRGWRFRVSSFGFQGLEVSCFVFRISVVGGFGFRVSNFRRRQLYRLGARI